MKMDNSLEESFEDVQNSGIAMFKFEVYKVPIMVNMKLSNNEAMLPIRHLAQHKMGHLCNLRFPKTQGKEQDAQIDSVREQNLLTMKDRIEYY